MARPSIAPDAMSRAAPTASFFVRSIDRISTLSAIVAGFALCLIVLSMSSEILLRFLWGISLKYNWDISSYAMAAVFFLPAGYGLKYGAHIRTSAIEMLAGPATVRTMDHVCFVLAGTTLAYTAYAMTMRAVSSYWSGAVSWTNTGIPVWLPEGLIAIGLAIFAAQCLAELLRSAVLKQVAQVEEQVLHGTSV